MRVITTTLLCLMLAMPVANAQIQPQTMRPSETMPDPGANWFMSISDFGSAGGMGGYIYDASTGEMHGLISLGGQSPAVQPNPGRHELIGHDCGKEIPNAAIFRFGSASSSISPQR